VKVGGRQMMVTMNSPGMRINVEMMSCPLITFST